MAREFGKLYMKMWARGSDFTRLTASAQRLYMFLISQPDLNRAGVITVAQTRWLKGASDLTPAELESDLRQLHRHRFVVVDEECQELLVRSYIKWDEGWKSPNIMISVKQTCEQIMSDTIRACIREELDRIDTSGLSSTVNERTGHSTRQVIERLIGETIQGLSDAVKDEGVMAFGNVGEDGIETLDETLQGNPVETLPKNPSTEPFPKGLGKGLGKGSLTTTTTATATATTTATATATYMGGGNQNGADGDSEDKHPENPRQPSLPRTRSSASGEATDRSPSAPEPDIELVEAELVPEEKTSGEREAPKRSRRSKPLREIPDDWEPTGRHREIALERGLDCTVEAERFVNYCRAHGKQYRDFDAAFSNWLTSGYTKGSQNTGGPALSRSQLNDLANRDLQRRAALVDAMNPEGGNLSW